MQLTLCVYFLRSRYKDLSKNRFASHVIQTLLVLGGGETVEREVSCRRLCFSAPHVSEIGDSDPYRPPPREINMITAPRQHCPGPCVRVWRRRRYHQHQ